MRTVVDYLTDVIPRLFIPILRELLTDDEFATLRFSIREFPDGEKQRGPTPIGQDNWSLFVEVKEEILYEPLFEPRPDRETAARFYSDVQDWISETTFGWGQLRGPMYPGRDQDES